MNGVITNYRGYQDGVVLIRCDIGTAHIHDTLQLHRLQLVYVDETGFI